MQELITKNSHVKAWRFQVKEKQLWRFVTNECDRVSFIQTDFLSR